MALTSRPPPEYLREVARDQPTHRVSYEYQPRFLAALRVTAPCLQVLIGHLGKRLSVVVDRQAPVVRKLPDGGAVGNESTHCFQ